MARTATASIIDISGIYGAAVGISRARIATLVFNDGKALDRIANGGDLNTRSYERAMLWFSANWPEALAWPEGIERPFPQDEAGQGAQPEGLVA